MDPTRFPTQHKHRTLFNVSDSSKLKNKNKKTQSRAEQQWSLCALTSTSSHSISSPIPRGGQVRAFSMPVGFRARPGGSRRGAVGAERRFLRRRATATASGLGRSEEVSSESPPRPRLCSPSAAATHRLSPSR